MNIILTCSVLLSIAISSSLCACFYEGDTGISECDVYTQWSDSEDGAVSWAKDCDFVGHDINKIGSHKTECGKLCLESKRCTHFTWKEGVCHIKSNFRQLAEEPNKSIGDICGYVPSRTDFARVGK